MDSRLTLGRKSKNAIQRSAGNSVTTTSSAAKSNCRTLPQISSTAWIVVIVILLGAGFLYVSHNTALHIDGLVEQVVHFDKRGFRGSHVEHKEPIESSEFVPISTALSSEDAAMKEDHSKALQKDGVLPSQELVPRSKYAYVTLISGIDRRFRYRGYLYNALIMLKALRELGSTADFIALIGFSEEDITPFQSDMELLRSHGIQTFILPRLLDKEHKLGFAEMALLKITPYSFVQYDRIQFLDGDVMPTKNMDCFFELNHNAFTVGAVSPLNSGWYLALPNMEAYEYMKSKAIWRLGRDWDEINGWGERMPDTLSFRGGKPCTKWQFNGADMDQGLFTHYFIINHGNALLIDTQLRKARYFAKGIKWENGVEMPMKDTLSCCDGIIPTAHFAHFTGRSKPWLQPNLATISEIGNTDLITWRNHLDSLGVDVNSSTISSLNLIPPLGYFNANFPKGGFQTKKTPSKS